MPVGRLDYDTTGALLLTNDGALAHRIMHPSFEVDKTYEAKVLGRITPEILNKLSIGVRLEDGMTAPAKVRHVLDDTLELTIHEGRNHQIKRMITTVGLEVIGLHRVSYAGLSLEGMTPGQWRDLTSAETRCLKMLQ